MKIIAIIQARMGSTRLPGKVLINIQGKTILNHVIDRVKQSKYIDEIIIATTNANQDDLIVNEALKNNCKYFRGSEKNVLERYYQAATLNNGDIIVRITSDCPLIDPKIIDEMLRFYINNSYDVVTNASADLTKRTYPRGLDVEIFSYRLLKEAYEKADKDYQLEHVTPYIYENNNNTFYYMNNVDYSKYRWTLDTKEDLLLIEEIYARLYINEHDFYLDNIIEIMEKNPYLLLINNEIIQKNVKE